MRTEIRYPATLFVKTCAGASPGIVSIDATPAQPTYLYPWDHGGHGGR